jgi:hypothetical protein
MGKNGYSELQTNQRLAGRMPASPGGTQLCAVLRDKPRAQFAHLSQRQPARSCNLWAFRPHFLYKYLLPTEVANEGGELTVELVIV